MDISQILTDAIAYVNTLTNGNEFATGMLIAMVTGWTAYLSKKVPSQIYYLVKKHMTVSLTINDDQAAYYEVMKILEEEKGDQQSRFIKLNNGQWGQSGTGQAFGYGRQLFRFFGHWVLVDVRRIEDTDALADSLTLTSFSRSHKFFNTLIQKISNNEKNIKDTEYFEWVNGAPYFKTTQPVRDLNTVFIESDEKRKLVDTITKFLDNKGFYEKHGIPYQLGILLYGEPGTGKTSLTRAIAGYMQKGIISADSISQIVGACAYNHDNIIVIEEVDTLGIGKRDLSDSTQPSESNKDSEETGDISEYGLGQVLKAVDGLIVNHGRVLIMTTNKPEMLDRALIRPGRIDVAIKISFMSMDTLTRMLKSFFAMEDQLLLIDNLTRGKTIKREVTGSDVQGSIVLGKTIPELVEEFTY